MASTKQDARGETRGRRSRGRRRAMIGRTIALLALLPLASRLPVHARIMAGLLRDPRVPASRKALLAAALGYVVSPLDLIPDRFPLLGVLDDLVVAALALDTFLAGVPEEALEEQLGVAGLARVAFDEDVRRVRRLAPRSLRRIVNRLPDAFEVGARVARDAGLTARARGLLNMEGSPA